MSDGAAELAIRMRRAAFNRALAEGDADAIVPILAPNAILITGTESTLIAGRKAQIAVWKRDFASAARTIYTRTPESIILSSVEPGALEQGRWQCAADAAGVVIIAGSYTAKWRKTGVDWVIEAELFLTLS